MGVVDVSAGGSSDGAADVRSNLASSRSKRDRRDRRMRLIFLRRFRTPCRRARMTKPSLDAAQEDSDSQTQSVIGLPNGPSPMPTRHVCLRSTQTASIAQSFYQSYASCQATFSRRPEKRKRRAMKRGDPLSDTFAIEAQALLIAACAAANRAMGTRKGEQLT